MKETASSLYSSGITRLLLSSKTVKVYLYKYKEVMKNNDYSYIQNKYYEIIDVISTKSEEFKKYEKPSHYKKYGIDEKLYNSDYRTDKWWGSSTRNKGSVPFFVLRETESGDIVYTGFPNEFILVGGFVKLQQEFIGENIFEVSDRPRTTNNHNELIKNKWKCVDVVLRRQNQPCIKKRGKLYE